MLTCPRARRSLPNCSPGSSRPCVHMHGVHVHARRRWSTLTVQLSSRCTVRRAAFGCANQSFLTSSGVHDVNRLQMPAECGVARMPEPHRPCSCLSTHIPILHSSISAAIMQPASTVFLDTKRRWGAQWQRVRWSIRPTMYNDAMDRLCQFTSATHRKLQEIFIARL